MLNLNSGQVQLSSFKKRQVILLSAGSGSVPAKLSAEMIECCSSELLKIHHFPGSTMSLQSLRSVEPDVMEELNMFIKHSEVSLFQRSLNKTRFPLFLKCLENSVVVFLYTCALKIVIWIWNMLQRKKCYINSSDKDSQPYLDMISGLYFLTADGTDYLFTLCA